MREGGAEAPPATSPERRHLNFGRLSAHGLSRLLLLALTTDTVSVTQAQLAEMTGLSRKTVNGHLRVLERAGIIGCEYRHIAIRDRRRLAARGVVTAGIEALQ